MSFRSVGRSRAMQDVMEAAFKDLPIVFTVASGNDNRDACQMSPAFVPIAITVGNIDDKNNENPSSNYGSCVDILAPGTQILSSWGRDNFYKRESGTSMSAPFVA